ncbi:hypothetical protein BGZ65_009505, partial [Modicella reniformis]
MEPSPPSSTPDLESGNIRRGPDSRGLTTRVASFQGSHIDTHFAHRTIVMEPQQLSSPPNSASTPSQSPSIDTTLQLISPSASSTTTSSQHADSRRLSMSEPAISQSTIAEIHKRRAPGSPLQRVRPLTQAHSERSRSMLTVRHLRREQTRQGANSEMEQVSKYPEHYQGESSAHRSIMMKSQISDGDSFWKEDPNDPDPVPENKANKRPKAELRGEIGRRARQSVWGNRKISLRRYSTSSMIGNLTLSSHQEVSKDNVQGVQNIFEDGLLNDEDATAINSSDPVQTPVMKESSRRPLTDISSNMGVEVLAAPVPPSVVPLTPLMTRPPMR